jgi:hypothetical protein
MSEQLPNTLVHRQQSLNRTYCQEVGNVSHNELYGIMFYFLDNDLYFS